jgi:hypothetical protein
MFIHLISNEKYLEGKIFNQKSLENIISIIKFDSEENRPISIPYFRRMKWNNNDNL